MITLKWKGIPMRPPLRLLPRTNQMKQRTVVHVEITDFWFADFLRTRRPVVIISRTPRYVKITRPSSLDNERDRGGCCLSHCRGSLTPGWCSVVGAIKWRRASIIWHTQANEWVEWSGVEAAHAQKIPLWRFPLRVCLRREPIDSNTRKVEYFRLHMRMPPHQSLETG